MALGAGLGIGLGLPLAVISIALAMLLWRRRSDSTKRGPPQPLQSSSLSNSPETEPSPGFLQGADLSMQISLELPPDNRPRRPEMEAASMVQN